MTAKAPDYLDKLSRFVAETRLEDLSETTVAAARDVVLDTIGAMLAGSRLPENASLAQLTQTLSGAGNATLLGHSLNRVQPVFAALANATAGVALELDEGSRLGGGHPSIHVTPGAIAVAEEVNATGSAALEAVIVGYEVTSRIGSGVQARAEVHSHGTWGTIGAAAATARLLGYDAAATRQAMNLAMSMSPANSWTPCLEGATIRNLYPGRSEFQGIMAAYLGKCGFTAINDGPADLYGSILGEGFDPQAVVAGWGGTGPVGPAAHRAELHQVPRLLPLQPSGAGRGAGPEAERGFRRRRGEAHRGHGPAHSADNGQSGAGEHAVGQVLHSLRPGRRPG